nr:MAG TPA: hypothetical protein [Caudoviricetes sp.]DAX87289.1 MAG TPA: hypothetical protein [Caudoviricetes sp.]
MIFVPLCVNFLIFEKAVEYGCLFIYKKRRGRT